MRHLSSTSWMRCYFGWSSATVGSLELATQLGAIQIFLFSGIALQLKLAINCHDGSSPTLLTLKKKCPLSELSESFIFKVAKTSLATI